MTEKEKYPLGRSTIERDGETFAIETFEHNGDRLTVSELTPDDGDETFEAAKDKDGKVNNSLQTKMLLSRALVEPKKTIEQIGKMGNQKYTKLLQAFNRLNSLPEANPTPPAGDAGPVPPAGGEPSPAS